MSVYLLDRVADLDTEPSVVLVRHVGADDTVHSFSPIGVRPGDAAWANIRAEFDEMFASKSVEASLRPSCRQTRTLDRDIRSASPWRAFVAGLLF
jgi:hypothetical protein